MLLARVWAPPSGKRPHCPTVEGHFRCPLCAMCGRLRVGKSFVDPVHCWSELPCVRPSDAALDTAAGHNALRGSGPGQKPALEAPWRKWVFLVREPTGVGALQVLLSPTW